MEYSKTLKGVVRPWSRSYRHMRHHDILEDIATRPALRPSNLVPFDGELLAETENDYLVGFGSESTWIPKAMAHDVEAGGLHEAISMQVPQWFAEDEGLD